MVNVFTVLSMGYFAYYLIRFDYVSLAVVSFSAPLMIGAVALLCLAVLVGALTWMLTLRLHGMKVPWRLALSSHGLSVFGKYIPGRIWTVLGRASQVAAQGFPFADASLLSLKAQLMNIWTGLAIGLIPTLLLAEYSTAGAVAIGFVLATAPFLFSTRVQGFVLTHVGRVVRRKLVMPPLSLRSTTLLFLVFAMLWVLYTSAFGLFVRALRPDALLRAAFSFPLAMNIGLIAIFVPGGLGVREGVMAGLLVAAGFDVREALTAALLSRLWFTAGEGFIFLLGLVVRMRHHDRQSRVGNAPSAERPDGESSHDSGGPCRF